MRPGVSSNTSPSMSASISQGSLLEHLVKTVWNGCGVTSVKQGDSMSQLGDSSHQSFRRCPRCPKVKTSGQTTFVLTPRKGDSMSLPYVSSHTESFGCQRRSLKSLVERLG
jgi:hypothetical protein